MTRRDERGSTPRMSLIYVKQLRRQVREGKQLLRAAKAALRQAKRDNADLRGELEVLKEEALEQLNDRAEVVGALNAQNAKLLEALKLSQARNAALVGKVATLQQKAKKS